MSNNTTDTTQPQVDMGTRPGVRGVHYAVLAAIFILGAYFRLVGSDWDGDYHLHPDERFMTMVASSISTPEEPADYFRTESSSLNPHNRGYGFYVYGTFPLFLVRTIAEQIGKTGYSEIHLVGRTLSAVADLITVLLVYLIAGLLYKKPNLSLLAAAFSAFSVLPIQLSHYFTVDSFTNTFTFMAFYFAVRMVSEAGNRTDANPDGTAQETTGRVADWLRQGQSTAISALLFGVGLGLAMASKVSAAPLALLLPAAAVLIYLRKPELERQRWAVMLVRNLVLAALVSFIVFRLGQPYAFRGPGIFGLGLNERWVSNLSSLSQQSSGDVDFPPALQWARRPITFAWTNMVVWGLGLPLGLTAWLGFLWMGFRSWKGEWHKHSLIWGWSLVYFTWQSLNFSRSMRYQLPIYPTLAIIAAWALLAINDRWGKRKGALTRTNRAGMAASLFLGALVLGTTAAWAFAFTRIYTRPVTRVAASEWIYQNVPAAINLHIDQNGDEIINQSLAFKPRVVIGPDTPLVIGFHSGHAGFVTDLKISNLVDVQLSPEDKHLVVWISTTQDGGELTGRAFLENNFLTGDDSRGQSQLLSFQPAIYLEADRPYYLNLQTLGGANLSMSGTLSLTQIREDGAQYPLFLPDPADVIQMNKPYITGFSANSSGELKEIYLPRVVDWEARDAEKTLLVTVAGDGNLEQAGITSRFLADGDPRGNGYTVRFDHPLSLVEGNSYSLQFNLMSGKGSIALYGSRQALESSWDDPLPLSMDGHNPFDYDSGAYRSELNFEMYWDDNPEKRERFLYNLERADYLFISSNRQWGTTVRVPERYPMTTQYYRSLIGCPPEKEIVWCYRVAEPGTFGGELGFELVRVFQSDPNLGTLRFNTQFAEEAFTVYDHPKVLIFKKSSDYDPARVKQILSAPDLDNVTRLTPGQAGKYFGDLTLSTEKLARQRAGGTWSELFNREGLQNRYPILAVLMWYLAITLAGWGMYPLVRLAFGSLSDKGYPVVKLAGFLLLAYPCWLAGSLGISVTRSTIGIIFLLLLGINAVLFAAGRQTILDEVRQRKRYFLLVEAMALSFFALFLLIRLGNPDLWHPYKGGEKPMDFSYFNAVIKSSIYPPYDPWYASGYINYYYYGFVLAGIPVKLLGIMPSIAYNLVLPTWFSFVAMAAFSVGWNLIPGFFPGEEGSSRRVRVTGGTVSAVSLLILGNLGIVRMIWHGFQKLAAPGAIEDGGFFQRWIWTFQGVGEFLRGSSLPYAPGDWYWIPSRAIPGEPITEFPFFTFLYADPHAHMFALPVTVLALLWVLSIIQRHWNWNLILKRGILEAAAVLFMGSLIIGTLRPTNTWDFPTFLGLGIVAVLYSALKDGPRLYEGALIGYMKANWKRILHGLTFAAMLGLLSFILFQPFSRWYGQAYTTIELWNGPRTPFWSYITHWGLFLYIILSWLAWETFDWMARTPLSALSRLYPYRGFLRGSLILVVLVTAGLLVFLDVAISWLVIPAIAWSVVLAFRKGMSDEKRIVLGLVCLALTITVAVELIVIKGDIGRMNTVFKFYLQAWTMLALSSAAALVWMTGQAAQQFHGKGRAAWQAVLALLVLNAALFPIVAGADKIRDRMTREAPHQLDGMGYMGYSKYNEGGAEMDLSVDYRAIRWMQDNITGSPVIVEANTPEYRWGSRYSIYTGLPGVVGWNWHQRQQRAILPSDLVTRRVEEIRQFYTNGNRQQTEAFLKRYGVSYIILGQLEKIVYGGTGLEKFPLWENDLWHEVYREGDTAIYKVID